MFVVCCLPFHFTFDTTNKPATTITATRTTVATSWGLWSTCMPHTWHSVTHSLILSVRPPVLPFTHSFFFVVFRDLMFAANQPNQPTLFTWVWMRIVFCYGGASGRISYSMLCVWVVFTFCSCGRKNMKFSNLLKMLWQQHALSWGEREKSVGEQKSH